MLYRKVWIIAALLMITSLARAQFTHPGILSTMDELNVVRNNQTAEPWKSALDALKASEPGSLSYSMQGPYSAVYRGSNNNEGWVQHGRDATACYVQALLGYITGNSAYTNNAIGIINAWSNMLNSIGGNDVELLAGIQGPLWAQAGEILAHTNTGWASSDITRAKNMLTNIFLPPMDGFASADGANFSTTCMYATMAIAVFTDNQSKFDDAWNAFISTAGCPNDFSLYKNIAENGQNVESGRDQVHSWSSYEMLSGLAEIAYHQGYAPYTLGSNRLKTGVEYWCKYNLGDSVAYDESVYRCRAGWGPWPEISDTNRGVPTEQGSVCNMVRRAYERLGQSTPYTSQMADAMGNTIVGATPRNGWGAPFIADALLSNTPAISVSLTATAGDGTVSLNWTRNGITLGRQDVFRDTDSDMNGRTMIAGDIGGDTSYIDNTAQNGVTYWYWIKATDASGTIINSNSASATSSSSDPTYYQLQNRGTGLVLDGYGRTANGDDCAQYASSTNHVNSHWEMIPMGSYYQFSNRGTGLLLDGMGRTTNGSVCGQWANTTSTNAQWRIEQFDGDYYRIQNVATDLYLDGMGETSNGADCGQWANTSSTNAQWELVSVSSSARISSSIVETEAETTGMNVYPNPVTDKVTISLAAPLEHANLLVHNSRGRLIRIEKVSGQEYDLDLSTSPRGVYILTLTNKEGKSIRKIVKE